MMIRGIGAAIAAIAFIPSTVFAAGFIAPPVSVGENLEVESRIALSEKAPMGGLSVRVASSDASRVLLSLQPQEKGSEFITVQIAEGQRSSPEFFFHGLANAGSVSYKLTATGLEPGTGQVTLTPSGIVVKGPAAVGTAIRSTPRSWPTKLFVFATQYDAAGEVIGTQKVRGGFAAKAKLSSANASVAGVAHSELLIEAGEMGATTELRPAGVGSTEVRVEATGFQAKGQYQRVPVEIYQPSIGILDEMHLGNNLQINTGLTLGEPAPEGGLRVTLTSKDPSRLLLAAGPFDKGSPSIVVTVPAGANTAAYSIHGMAGEGTASYTASAPGFREREATLPLVPSGVIITGPTGLPDEVEVLRPEVPLSPNGFQASASRSEPIRVTIYTVRLDPKTHRGADLTVQNLRADLTLKVDLRNDNPELGHLSKSIVIKGGEGQGSGTFTPKAPGLANLTFETPAGFTRPTNATDLKAHISE